MRFLVVLSLLAVLAASSPTTKQQPWDVAVEVSERFQNSTLTERDEQLSKRQDGGVIICRDINWAQGTCGYAKQPWNVCIRLDSPWWHTISSIGPDEYNAIVAYSDFNCGSSDQIAIFNPGYGLSRSQADLRTVGWNDKIGSFKVFQIPGKNCLGGDLNSHPAIDPLTDCNRCCEGCNRSGTGCCPAGAFC
ncbi:hypothetical protein C8A03DRAFT_33609 [Achaetomium macrosporum]|uniref:Uncharacterized protein n=1 Tax=Achaetomium macrosporum TaxID=79813 RepID=A0AAN7HCF3_9PEZI|nr:hypothetical protein C8A03DRAFT_33609 [Achaetomium macrosporum]